MIKAFLLVGAGGAVGCMTRYAIALFVTKLQCQSLWATLACNVLGCLFIGLLLGCLLKTDNADFRLLLVTGFCGGFTTFSTFSADALALWQNGQTTLALTYVLGSLVVGIMFVLFGIKLCS